MAAKHRSTGRRGKHWATDPEQTQQMPVVKRAKAVIPPSTWRRKSPKAPEPKPLREKRDQ